jgi:DNA primase
MAGGSGGIEEVRARADILEVIGAHVRLRRAGRNYVGLCPFHDEKTPSFSVNAERGFFHCFGCGVGGTVFDFVMKADGLTFSEALHSLARRYGIDLPESRTGFPAAEREALASANQIAAEFFSHVLWNTDEGAPARDYLKRRGITDETARAFMLGFAPARPANLATVMTRRNLSDAALKTGLIKRENGGGLHDMFRARLMFPIRDAQARVIAFGGRVLDDHLPKYINSVESPIYSKSRSVYGLYEARAAIAKTDRAIVVEGYIDAIALAHAGFNATVASLGTALTVDQLRLLGRYTKNIVACFDGDNAGRKASLRALEIFLNAGMTGWGVFIPAGFDPDTFVRERGAQSLRELLDAAQPLVDFFLKDQAASAVDDPSRARAAERIAAILAMVRNPFEYDLLARKAAGLLRIDEKLLRRESSRRGLSKAANDAPTRSLTKAAAAAHQPRPDATVQAKIGLLAIALHFPALRPEIFSGVANHLQDDRLWPALQEVCFSEESAPSLETRMAQLLDDDQRSYLSALTLKYLPESSEQASAEASEYVVAITRARQRQAAENRRRSLGTRDTDEVSAAQETINLLRQPRS